MDIASRYPLRDRCIVGIVHELAHRTGQQQHVAIHRCIPSAGRNTRCKHLVEQLRTRRGQQQAALFALRFAPTSGKQRIRAGQVLSFAAKALRTEVVRHTALTNLPQTLFRQVAIPANRMHGDLETVTTQRAAADLAIVTLRIEDLQRVILDRTPIGRLATGELHGEVLCRHRIAIFQTGIAHGDLTDTGQLGQFARHLVRVAFAFAYGEKLVLAVTRRTIAELFDNNEIFGGLA